MGVKTVSCFTTHGNEMKIQTRDRTIEFSFSLGFAMGIIPADDPIEMCNRLKEQIKLKRELTTSYIEVFDIYAQGVGNRNINDPDRNVSTFDR